MEIGTILDNVHSMNTSRLIHVPAAGVIHEWPRVANLVRTALARGEGSYVEGDVAWFCIGGAWKLWIVEQKGMVQAICITEIANFPRQRKCMLRYLAGSMEAIEPHIPAVEDYARREGCKILEGYARKGWARRMPDWTQKNVVMQKDL